MIQYDLMWGKLSSSSRDTAIALRSSKPVVSGSSSAGASQRLERQGDEGAEAACLVLKIAQPQQVIDTILHGFDVAVEHRRIRRQTLTVCLTHHVEPLIGVGLTLDDAAAGRLGEDLGPAARHRVEPGFLQLGDDPLNRHPIEAMEEEDLDGRKRLDVEVRAELLDALHHLDEICPRQIRM